MYVFNHLGNFIFSWDTIRFYTLAPAIVNTSTIFDDYGNWFYVPLFSNDGGIYNFYYDSSFGWGSESWNVDGKIQKGVATTLYLNNAGYDYILYGTDDDTVDLWIKVL